MNSPCLNISLVCIMGLEVLMNSCSHALRQEKTQETAFIFNSKDCSLSLSSQGPGFAVDVYKNLLTSSCTKSRTVYKVIG